MADGRLHIGQEQPQEDELGALLARLRAQQGQEQRQLTQAQEQAQRTQRSPLQAGLKFLSGAGAAIAGRDPGAAQQRFGQALQQRAQQPIVDLQARSKQRAAQLQQTTGALQVREAGKQAERAQRLRDPTSLESQIKRRGLAGTFPGGMPALLEFIGIDESAFEQITAQDADALLRDPVQFKAKADQTRLKVQREQDKLAAKQQREDKKLLNENVRKFSTTIGKTKIIESKARFDKVREIMVELVTKQAKLEGRQIDETTIGLPGFANFKSLLPQVLQEEDARRLQNAVQGLANIALNDVSGASVSVEEFERFARSIGFKELLSPRVFIEALDTLFNSFEKKAKNILAGANKETADEFFRRGGSLDLGPSLMQAIRTAGAQQTGLSPAQQEAMQKFPSARVE